MKRAYIGKHRAEWLLDLAASIIAQVNELSQAPGYGFDPADALLALELTARVTREYADENEAPGEESRTIRKQIEAQSKERDRRARAAM